MFQPKLTKLAQQLKSMKQSPELGGDFSAEQLRHGYIALMRNLGAPVVQTPHFGFADYFAYVSYRFSHVFAMPRFAAAALASVFLFSWGVVVNASYGSVPGDKLYAVKIATEKVQLSFVAPSDAKVKLQAEFAARRLEEFSQVVSEQSSSQNVQAYDMRVREAASQAQKGITSVNEALSASQTHASNPEASRALAAAVDRRVSAYSATVRMAQRQASSGVAQSLAGTAGALSATRSTAIEVMMSAFEKRGDEEALHELTVTFIHNRTDATLRFDALSPEQQALVLQGQTDLRIKEASALAAAQDFRGAFRILHELEAALDAAEAQEKATLEASASAEISQEGELEGEGTEEREVEATVEDSASVEASSESTTDIPDPLIELSP